MSRSAVLLALFTAVCSAASAVPPPPAPVPVPPAPPRENWRAKAGLPEEIDPQKVAFAKPADGETFRKLAAAAREIAGADWAKRAGDRYPYCPWNGGSDGFNQMYRGVWEKVANLENGPAARPNHTVRIHTTLYAGKPPTAYGFEVQADWNPKTGWGAAVEFSTFERKNGPYESFRVKLRHDEHLPAPRNPNLVPGLLLGPGMAYISVFRTDERFVYRFYVTGRPGGARGDNQKPLGREIARYWASADSFRESALEELDRLEANVKEGIPSGKLAEITTRGGPTGADVPMPVPNKDAGGAGTVAVPEAFKKEMLKEALAEIESRKKLVKEHYKEMHAATVAAFPGLGEIVSPPKK